MKRLAPLLLLMACCGLAQAQALYRWVDKDGRVHYADRPPPAKVKELREKRLVVPAGDETPSHALRQASEHFPVVLYVATECPPCDTGRDYLRRRGVPFDERMLTTEEEAAPLRERLGGKSALTVPVLQVGERLNAGYLESAWAGLLDAAGYPRAGRQAAQRPTDAGNSGH